MTFIPPNNGGRPPLTPNYPPVHIRGSVGTKPGGVGVVTGHVDRQGRWGQTSSPQCRCRRWGRLKAQDHIKKQHTQPARADEPKLKQAAAIRPDRALSCAHPRTHEQAEGSNEAPTKGGQRTESPRPQCRWEGVRMAPGLTGPCMKATALQNRAPARHVPLTVNHIKRQHTHPLMVCYVTPL